jgi:hypothetical protein
VCSLFFLFSCVPYLDRLRCTSNYLHYTRKPHLFTPSVAAFQSEGRLILLYSSRFLSSLARFLSALFSSASLFFAARQHGLGSNRGGGGRTSFAVALNAISVPGVIGGSSAPCPIMRSAITSAGAKPWESMASRRLGGKWALSAEYLRSRLSQWFPHPNLDTPYFTPAASTGL